MRTIPDDGATVASAFPQPGQTRALAGLALLFCLCAPASQAAVRKPVRSVPAPAADFERLSGSRAAACAAPLAAAGQGARAGMGDPSLHRCAWSGRLEMLYWQTLPETRDSCLPAPALAWHRLGAAAGAAVPAWSEAWNGQALAREVPGLQQAGAVWRRPDGQWSAVLWRWRPSERAATRRWQAGHWKEVTGALAAIGSGSPSPLAVALLSAWQDATRGKPRVLAGDAARWVSGGACLNLRTAGIGQAQLHLPFSRDDARLEQRSAMQVQLARRYPEAEWLRPFTLLESATPGARSGAKFYAVWKEGTTLNGQLWITLRGDAGIVRARIGAEAQGAAQSEPVKARAALLERELAALAHAWEARHE